VIEASRRFLRPIARWMLRSGVTWKEFAELARGVFVQTATEEFGIKGRPTNVSRVALLTGLTRREVRRQRLLQASPLPAEDESLSHATRVLSAWHLDPDFVDELGQPRLLPPSGPPPSFDALLRRHAGDIPPKALAKDLLRAGSIEELEDGRYRPLRRFHMPTQMDPLAVRRSGSVLADLGTTIEHNLSRGTHQPSRFEGRAHSAAIDPRALPAFRAFLEREAQGFLERVDDWLSAHETNDSTAARVRLGAGVYAIHDRDSGEGR